MHMFLHKVFPGVLQLILSNGMVRLTKTASKDLDLRLTQT